MMTSPDHRKIAAVLVIVLVTSGLSGAIVPASGHSLDGGAEEGSSPLHSVATPSDALTDLDEEENSTETDEVADVETEAGSSEEQDDEEPMKSDAGDGDETTDASAADDDEEDNSGEEDSEEETDEGETDREATDDVSMGGDEEEEDSEEDSGEDVGEEDHEEGDSGETADEAEEDNEEEDSEEETDAVSPGDGQEGDDSDGAAVEEEDDSAGASDDASVGDDDSEEDDGEEDGEATTDEEPTSSDVEEIEGNSVEETDEAQDGVGGTDTVSTEDDEEEADSEEDSRGDDGEATTDEAPTSTDLGDGEDDVTGGTPGTDEESNQGDGEQPPSGVDDEDRSEGEEETEADTPETSDATGAGDLEGSEAVEDVAQSGPGDHESGGDVTDAETSTSTDLESDRGPTETPGDTTVGNGRSSEPGETIDDTEVARPDVGTPPAGDAPAEPTPETDANLDAEGAIERVETTVAENDGPPAPSTEAPSPADVSVPPTADEEVATEPTDSSQLMESLQESSEIDTVSAGDATEPVRKTADGADSDGSALTDVVGEVEGGSTNVGDDLTIDDPSSLEGGSIDDATSTIDRTTGGVRSTGAVVRYSVDDTTDETLSGATAVVDGATDAAGGTTGGVDGTTDAIVSTVDGGVDGTTDAIVSTVDGSLYGPTDQVDDTTSAITGETTGATDYTAAEALDGTMEVVGDGTDGAVDPVDDTAAATVDSTGREAGRATSVSETVAEPVRAVESPMDRADQSASVGSTSPVPAPDARQSPPALASERPAGPGPTGTDRLALSDEEQTRSASDRGGRTDRPYAGQLSRPATGDELSSSNAPDRYAAAPPGPDRSGAGSAGGGDAPESAGATALVLIGLLGTGAVARSSQPLSGLLSTTSVGPLRLQLRAGARTVRARLSRFPRVWPFPGYSRYDDSDPLENDRRNRLFDAIDASPGENLSTLVERTSVSRSNARYHLRILEHEGMVTSAKVFGKRRFYPADVDEVELEAALADETTRTVLDTIASHEPADGTTLTEALGRDPSTVTHHLQRLAEAGLVDRERDGRQVVNRLTPAARSTLERTTSRMAGGTRAAGSSDD